MDIKCEYCGSMISSFDRECPNCGAPNDKMSRQAKGVPTTIEEMKKFCEKYKVDLEKMHFHIGENYTEPKAFGIYENNGEFIVYKNKADGSRAIRYQGTDEAYAVNEIYQKLKAELIEYKTFTSKYAKNNNNDPNYSKTTEHYYQTVPSVPHVTKPTYSYSNDYSNRRMRRSNGRGCFVSIFVGIIFAIVLFNIILGSSILKSSSDDLQNYSNRGYYSYNNQDYYYDGGNWYQYADNSWNKTDIDSDFSENYEDYKNDDYDGKKYTIPDYDYDRDNNWNDDWDDDDWNSGHDSDYDYGSDSDYDYDYDSGYDSDWDSDW